MNCYDELVMMI